MPITQAVLKELLNYDPRTGLLTWKSTGKGRRANCLAGGFKSKYALIGIGYRRYRIHRLVWLYVYGEWPREGIDHINGNPLDNRISNLRIADKSKNGANSRTYKNNTSGTKGVSWSHRDKKWYATIRVNYKRIFLGSYSTIACAQDAYISAAKKHFGEFVRIA